MTPRRRQRYTSPDGIDWRDPDMPVLRPFEFNDGTKGLKAFTPEEEQEYVKCHMAGTPQKHWRDDETYRLRKRGRNRRK